MRIKDSSNNAHDSEILTTTLQVRIKTVSLQLSLMGIESVDILNNEFKETK